MTTTSFLRPVLGMIMLLCHIHSFASTIPSSLIPQENQRLSFNTTPERRGNSVWLSAPHQALEAEVTTNGLHLHSHAEKATDIFQVRPVALGRESLTPITEGEVRIEGADIELRREGLSEIFSGSVAGIRQDFLVQKRPNGTGDLTLNLAIEGARISGAGEGVNVLTQSGRALRYSQLHITDADGKVLTGQMQAISETQLQITVDDDQARYPVLIDPTFSDANWQAFAPDAGGSPNNQVRAMVEYQGDLYVGGTFAQVAGEQVYYIARWNGYRWQKLGDGVNNAVYAMTVFNDKLIVGGSFTTASGESVLRIASWDGNNWQALGDGLNSSVVDLTVYNGELIAGGIFTAAGGISVNRIARWDGSNWHAMGGPDHGTVNSVSEFDGDLIVVGSFYMVNGENHNYITRWDGSSWSSLGEGLNTTVNDAVEFQGKLYVTGQFTGSGGHALPYIAAWDGSAWSAVGGGLSDAGYSLYADNDKLYVGGQFETADGISSLGIAAWDGSSWQAVGDGLGLYAGTVIRIYRIAKFDNEILLGGLLDKNGVVNLVRLNNDSEWQGFQSTFLDGSTQVVAEYDGDTIVGGDFTEISGIAANRIARWDGSQWHAMGDGFNGTVTTIASYQGELYAAGAFDHSGSSAVAHVARWDGDGQTWQPLTTGVNNTVYRVKVINDELWVLGDFSSAGGESATGMARWDGSQWLSVDFPYQVHYGPTDVVEYQGEVVVSGRFYNPEGFLLFKVAAFDGEQWYPLELDAVTGMVLSMAVHDDVLYVTGNIYRMNESVSASGVAAWDGSQWSNVGDSDVGSGKTLQSFKQELFLGSDSGLYVLENGTFQQPDTSVNQLINGLDVANDSLYLTGSFSSAGGKPAQNLARLIPTVSVSLDEQLGGSAVETKYFPDSTIKLPQPTREHYTLTGWNTANDGSGTNYTTNLPLASSAVNLYAQWQLKSYTISFDSAGGSSVADMEVAYGESVTAPTAPTRTGYTFTGWSPALPNTMPGEDLNVTAQWQINIYTLTFDSAGGNAVAPQNVNYGTATSTPTSPVREGYTFTGWSPAIPTSMPANDVTVTAQWQINTYTLIFDSSGGSTIGAQGVNYDTAPTAPVSPAREGYTFTGWSPAIPDSMPANDVTVTAQWQINTYTLTFDSNGGSEVAPQNVNYETATVTPASPAREGHTFTGWSPAIPASMPAHDVTVTAQWQINTYTLTFDSSGGSTIGAQGVNYDTTPTAPASPIREGYTFTGWSPAIPDSMPANDVTVTAQWQINTYTLTFDSNGGSAVAPQSINYGGSVSVPVEPVWEGHSFVGWNPALPDTMPANDVTVTAQWDELTYEVTTSVTGNASVSPPTQTITHGDSASVMVMLDNANDVVQVDSNCSASLSGLEITTAGITANCTITVSVFPFTDVERDSTAPMRKDSVARFRFTGGAGEKELLMTTLKRGGIENILAEDDVASILSTRSDGSYEFTARRTGRYALEFTDSVSGELTSVTFDVLPYLAFVSSQQPAQTGKAMAVRLWLSDEPIEYPVTADLSLQGVTMDSTTITLIEGDARTQTVTALAQSSGEARITLTASTVTNALPGTPAQHRLAVRDAPLPLSLDVVAEQAGEETYVVERMAGPVTLNASELNGTSATYQWSSEGITLSATGHTATFDPATLAEGRYWISLSAVSDEGTEGVFTQAIRVIDQCPLSDCAGAGETGIPAMANPVSDSPNQLPLCPAGTTASRISACATSDTSALLVEAPGRYVVSLGELSEAQSWLTGQFGLGVSDGVLDDPEHTQIGVISNLDIKQLSYPGESVAVVIPLAENSPIPADALWRKYINDQWQDFVENDSNQLHSAARTALGFCPGVSSDQWSSGLNEGDLCVRLTLEDGGPNDDDGTANRIIRDPGTLAVYTPSEPEPEPEPQPEPEPETPVREYRAEKSGGSMGLLSGLVVLLLGAGTLCRRRNAIR